MVFFYNSALFFYVLGIRIASIFNAKAKLWIQGRKSIFNKISNEVKEPVIWFHCASLGEFEMSRPLIEGIRIEFPGKKILLTFFSPSGFENKKNYDQVDHVFYLPIDSRKNAEQFIEIIKPEIAVFAKYEFWHYYLNKLKSKKIPVFLISALFRKEQRFFKWYGTFFRNDLNCYTKLFVQDNFSATQLKSIHVDSVVAGDNRMDRVFQHAKLAQNIEKITDFKSNSTLLILGSSWPEEEELVKNQLEQLPSQIKIVIAPHDISESHLQSIEHLFKNKCIRYSNYQTGGAERILIIDNIGLLSSIYQYSDYAFIGGGFTGKLHNILEPAAFGCVVFFGNKHTRFPEANQLLQVRGAFHADENFAKKIQELETNSELKSKSKSASKQFIESNIGATEKIMVDLRKVIKKD